MRDPETADRRRAQRLLVPLVALLVLAGSGSTRLLAFSPPEPDLARVLMTTPLGEIVVEVDQAAAPVTAGNFLAHVDEGLFEAAHFYRVVRLDNQPDNDVLIEVIQGGLGFEAESPRSPIEHETTEKTGLRHVDGALSMARLEPGSASSEFFICIGNQSELDFGGERNPDGQGFAVFGRVVEGMDVVRAIQSGEADGQMLLETVPITAIGRVP